MVGRNDRHTDPGGIPAMVRKDMGGGKGKTASGVSLTGLRDDVITGDPYFCILNDLDEVFARNDVDAFRGNEWSHARHGLCEHRFGWTRQSQKLLRTIAA